MIKLSFLLCLFPKRLASLFLLPSIRARSDPTLPEAFLRQHVECPSGLFTLRLTLCSWAGQSRTGFGSLDVSSELHLMSGDILEMTLWYFETPYNFFINLPAVNELWSALRSENWSGGQRNRWRLPHLRVVKLASLYNMVHTVFSHSRNTTNFTTNDYWNYKSMPERPLRIVKCRRG